MADIQVKSTIEDIITYLLLNSGKTIFQISLCKNQCVSLMKLVGIPNNIDNVELHDIKVDNNIFQKAVTYFYLYNNSNVPKAIIDLIVDYIPTYKFPRRPCHVFDLFRCIQMTNIMKTNPELSAFQRLERIRTMWTDISLDKKIYIEEYEKAKEKYNEKIQKYIPC